jgi:hypothetical protein
MVETAPELVRSLLMIYPFGVSLSSLPEPALRHPRWLGHSALRTSHGRRNFFPSSSAFTRLGSWVHS